MSFLMLLQMMFGFLTFHLCAGSLILEMDIIAYHLYVYCLIGDVIAANSSHREFFHVWKRYGVLPERYFLILLVSL